METAFWWFIWAFPLHSPIWTWLSSVLGGTESISINVKLVRKFWSRFMFASLLHEEYKLHFDIRNSLNKLLLHILYAWLCMYTHVWTSGHTYFFYPYPLPLLAGFKLMISNDLPASSLMSILCISTKWIHNEPGGGAFFYSPVLQQY